MLLRLLFLITFLYSSAAPSSAARKGVELYRLSGVINPASARYLVRAMERAEAESLQCLIIEFDTPGGLDPSMRMIIKRMLTAEVPIVVYVAPSGSRAASAGAFITIAAHVAAMAPGTNIGAAHPVALGSGMDSTTAEKVANDAAAYIKSLAEKRGRNVEWAEQAVRKSVSATEKEAKTLGIIDFVCEDVEALLDSLNGRSVALPSGEVTLKTKGAHVTEREMGWRDRFLTTLSDPNIAYILMILGFYGLIFELSNPGAVLPGVVGGICIILAFFAFQTLSVNYAGLMLILFALLLFLADVLSPTHGILTTGGVIAMALGSTMLFESSDPFIKLSWTVIIPAVVTTALFFTFAIGMGLRAQKRKPTGGMDTMIGQVGEARTVIEKDGIVFVNGEHWKAASEIPIAQGEQVRVIGVERSVLRVEKVG
jgi:membrane-bound serine protease (ClpP class)